MSPEEKKIINAAGTVAANSGKKTFELWCNNPIHTCNGTDFTHSPTGQGCFGYSWHCLTDSLYEELGYTPEKKILEKAMLSISHGKSNDAWHVLGTLARKVENHLAQERQFQVKAL